MSAFLASMLEASVRREQPTKASREIAARLLATSDVLIVHDVDKIKDLLALAADRGIAEGMRRAREEAAKAAAGGK